MDLSVYKALFRCSPYPYLVMDTKMIIIGASGSYLRSVQRTEADIVGKHLFDAFPPNPDDPESTNMAEVKASIARALTKGQPDTTSFLRYSIPVRGPAGIVYEERYWSTVHTPVMDEEGNPAFLFQNAIDVSSLYRFNKSSETATLRQTPYRENNRESFNDFQMHEALSRILNNEREHLRSLFDQAPGFVAVLMGPEHVFELANKAYYQLVGHRDIIGKTVWDALPEVAGQGFEEFLASVYNTGTPWAARSMPIAVQRERNGPIVQRYVDLVYEPYRDKYGNTIGIFAQGYDVTEAVEAQAAKRESDERLKDGLDAAKMVVWDWDFVTDQLEYSDNMVGVMGIAPETMDEISKHVHQDDQETMKAAHSGALSGARTYQTLIRFIRPDNEQQIWVDSRGRVRYDALGNALGIRGVTVDVTERHHAEFELRAAARRKDEFLAMLAHELRNPLAPITNAAEFLKLVAHNDAKVSRASEVIIRQAKHMTALVDDLLDVSRVKRGLTELNKDVVDINAVVHAAVEQTMPLIEAKKQHLKVSIGDARGTVHGDRNRLVQITANLLNNAAKYTPNNGFIAINASADEQSAYIEVTDSGIGIAKELLPHIFELFTQAERTPDRAQGGLGIGLALVKTLVVLHGGDVTASSAGIGTGSTFRVTLPIIMRPR